MITICWGWVVRRKGGSGKALGIGSEWAVSSSLPVLPHEETGGQLALSDLSGKVFAVAWDHALKTTPPDPFLLKSLAHSESLLTFIASKKPSLILYRHICTRLLKNHVARGLFIL